MKLINLKSSGVIQKPDPLVRKSDNWCFEVSRCSFWNMPLVARCEIDPCQSILY